MPPSEAALLLTQTSKLASFSSLYSMYKVATNSLTPSRSTFLGYYIVRLTKSIFARLRNRQLKTIFAVLTQICDSYTMQTAGSLSPWNQKVNFYHLALVTSRIIINPLLWGNTECYELHWPLPAACVTVVNWMSDCSSLIPDDLWLWKPLQQTQGGLHFRNSAWPPRQLEDEGAEMVKQMHEWAGS